MKGYKIATIVLSIIVVLQLLFIGWIFQLGYQAIDNENICYYDVCKMDTLEYSAWYYDDYEKVCYCYEGDDITQQKYLGGN